MALMPLYAGATVCLMEAFSPTQALRIIQEEGVTFSFLLPSLLDGMRSLPQDELERFSISKLRVLISSTDFIRKSTKKPRIKEGRTIPIDTRDGGIKLILIFLIFFTFLLFPFARHRVLGGMGKFLVLEDPTEQADLAVILSGSYWDRAREAVDVYKEGYVRRILIMNELRPTSYDELLSLGIKVPLSHEIDHKILLSYKVPPASIHVMDEEANSTYQEAKLIRQYVREKGFKSVIVITSRFHTRRACMTIASFLGKKFKVICRPSRYDPFRPKNWWQERKQIENVILEYEKLTVYLPFILINKVFF